MLLFWKAGPEMHCVDELDAKTKQAMSAAAAADAATDKLQSAQHQVKGLELQLGQTQSALQSLKDKQLADQQKALASEASLTLTLKGKDSQLDSVRESLRAAEAKLQPLQEESANVEALEEQMQSLQAELKTEREAHNSLKQQHAEAITEAAATSNNLNAAVKSKSAEMKKVAKVLSAKATELQEAKVTLKEAQDQVTALQGSVELKDSSERLRVELEQQQHTQHEEAAAAREEELKSNVARKDTECQQACTALAVAEASLKKLTTDHEASCAKVIALEATVKELTNRSVDLQQQLQQQTEALTNLQQQHASAQQALSTKEAEAAAGVTEHESQLDMLRQCLSVKGAKVQEVTAALELSNQQVGALQAAAKTPRQASSEQASRQTDVLSVLSDDNMSAAETTQSEQLKRQAGADSAKISQLQQQVKDDSTKVSQLESHTEHLRKMLGDKNTQYSQLLQQHQALQAMAAEASQEGDQQEADSRQKDAVIQQLQQRLVTTQHLLAEPAERPAPASGSRALPEAPAGAAGNRPPIQQEGQPEASPLSSPTLNLATPTSTNRITSGKQATTRSVQNSRPMTASTWSVAQPAAIAVSTKAVSPPSLSMPVGSVYNPLAGQPDLDDHNDHNDHSSRSKLRPLSPQLSGLISDSDSNTDSGTGDEVEAGLGIMPHVHDQVVRRVASLSMPDALGQKEAAAGGEEALQVSLVPIGHIICHT